MSRKKNHLNKTLKHPSGWIERNRKLKEDKTVKPKYLNLNDQFVIIIHFVPKAFERLSEI
jgi:hypothetical protein